MASFLSFALVITLFDTARVLDVSSLPDYTLITVLSMTEVDVYELLVYVVCRADYGDETYKPGNSLTSRQGFISGLLPTGISIAVA